MKLGRFLEISLHTPRIRESLEFYEALGFVQATVGEIWSHPYAVVTDGRLFLGLHGAPSPPPLLTFVLPDLARGVARLRDDGVEFDQEQLGDDVFNEAVFRDPAGLTVRLIEARTFSPPQLDGAAATECGYFSELGVPVRDSATACSFWERLGFVALEETQQPFARAQLTSDLLNMGLYRTRAFRSPVLTFEDDDTHARIARLRERGFTLTDEMPDNLDDASNAVLIAPEGTRLLLLASGE